MAPERRRKICIGAAICRTTSATIVRQSLGTSSSIHSEWGCVFSPDVCVFRGPESAGYPFLPAPFFVSVLTAAAYERPRLEGGQLGDEFAAGTAKKITHFLRAAKLNGADCLVLSAFGCGAFGNPPGHVAEIFRSILFADEFAGQFRLVRFAIIEDQNGPDGGNVAPFRRVFGDVGAA